MKKRTYFLFLLFIFTLLITPINAKAAVTITSATLNNATNITVNMGATISATVSVKTTSNTGWKSTAWRIGNSGSYSCANTSNHNNNNTYSETFNITTPSTAGTYPVDFIAYNDDNCGNTNGSTSSNTYTMNNAIIILNIQPMINYRFDECALSGTNEEVKDSSGNNYNATVKGSSIPQASTQIINNGISFQRANQQYVQLPTLPISKPNFNDGFTVTTWAKFSGTAGSWERIFDFGNGANANNIFLGREGTTNTLILGIHGSSTGDNYLRATNAIADTNWHLWAVTCSGTTCNLYKDGASIATSTTMKIPSNIARTSNYIGKSNWDDAYFEGSIDEFKVFDDSLSATQISTIYTNELAKKNYDGTIRVNPCGYCSINALSDGFHVVNPFNDINKSIEIFCSNNRDFIALPNKNSSNNFVFNSNTLSTTNYYNEAATNGVSFQAIEINAYTLDVITNSSLRTPQTVGSFKTMGSSFSNINLTATPFAIDWGNTTISDCNQSKLRTAYYGQDVKINSLDYDSKAICNISKMKLKLLDDYRYLEYDGSEVLQKSCKIMAENVPESFLASSSIQGHYWISPFSTARNNSTDITAVERPIVVYCWYQTDLDWVWTFSLAMDGKVTNQKSDLVNKSDTCSKFGLSPFVPNNEKTFERVREFLYDKKSQWVNYTGTNNEKFKMFNNNSNYYLNTEYDGIIWPYGSFGVYFPYAGDHTKNNVSQEWGGSNNADPGPMSGSPMHNISSITTDYARLSNDGGYTNRDYYSWGVNRAELDITTEQAGYSDTDTVLTDGSYAYAATMGAKGWVSILGSADLNKTDEWFISRTGAGVNFDHLSSDHPYYEPNGNYTAGAWLNFLFDSAGRVRHLDDLNAAYSYYDYMCMAEDNYDFTTRYTLVKGPFNAIEHSIATGRETTDTALTTKIVNNTLRFDILLLNDSMTALQADKNVSVGIFLDDDNSGASRDLYYFGDIKKNGTGTFNALKSTGRFELPASAWPSGSNTWSKANKSLFFHFKYCAKSDASVKEWTDCWTLSNNAATCKSGYESYCAHAESLNDFAIRPDKFDVDITGTTPYKAGKSYNVTFYAKDYANNNTVNYNEKIPLTPTETLANCITGVYDTNLSNLTFTNGIKNIPSLSYSEVGVVNIKIKETQGAEFASTDASDTSDELRYITPYDQNWTYTPDHFGVTGTITNGANAYTYISSDLNMSLILDLNITAQKENNVTTQNYNNDCYAKITDYILSYDNLAITPANALSTIKYLETNTSTEGNVSINHAMTLNTINKSIFSTDHNGSAFPKIKMNFDRNITKPSNPFSFVMRDVNVSDEDTIKGSKDFNQSSPFYYGRVYSTDYRGPTDINTTIRYEVYCKDCNRTNMNITGTQSPTSLTWYQNTLHVTADGNVTTFSSVGTTRINNLDETTSGVVANGLENNMLRNATAPYTDRILMRPSPWLLYNLYNAGATTNDFTAEFIRAGNWAGQGSLGNTVDVNSSIRTNRRMEW